MAVNDTNQKAIAIAIATAIEPARAHVTDEISALNPFSMKKRNFAAVPMKTLAAIHHAIELIDARVDDQNADAAPPVFTQDFIVSAKNTNLLGIFQANIVGILNLESANELSFQSYESAFEFIRQNVNRFQPGIKFLISETITVS